MDIKAALLYTFSVCLWLHLILHKNAYILSAKGSIRLRSFPLTTVHGRAEERIAMHVSPGICTGPVRGTVLLPSPQNH